MSIIINFIAGACDLLAAIFPFLKKTYFYKRYAQWFNKIHVHNRLYGSEKINKEISKMNFNDICITEQLDGRNLVDIYKEDMREMTIRDYDGKTRVIRIPYMEIVNFIKHPETKINISCSSEDPLLLNEKYELPKEPGDLNQATRRCLVDLRQAKQDDNQAIIQKCLKDIKDATQNCLDMVKNYARDDPHPRLASLKRICEDEYICVLEETHYYTQIKTNLSMDWPLMINGHRRTMRELELDTHVVEQDEWDNLKIPNDALHPYCLTSLEKSILANVIGVSAIWCMADENDDKPVYYLMPRNKKVGVYKKKLGMPSGDIESPQYKQKPQSQQYRFRNSSLIDYLEWEIAREFAEETGIADIDKPLDDYSIEVDPNKIKLKIEMEIIPLALTREILRGGKPQMFFLIRTKKIDIKVLKECFLSSSGLDEFKSDLVTSATISAEVACNYLYAQEYIQARKYNIITLT